MTELLILFLSFIAVGIALVVKSVVTGLAGMANSLRPF